MNTKMKFLWFCCLFLAIGIHAQESVATTELPKKNKGYFEAGVSPYGITLRPGNFYTSYKMVFDGQFLSGMYLKYHKGLNAMRWEMNYSQRNMYYPLSSLGSGMGKSPTKSWEFKMGYQRSFSSRKFSFYGFADLEYNYFWAPYTSYRYPYPYLYSIADQVYPYPYFYTMRGSLFCLTPGAGFRWRLGKHLALGYEMAAQFFYARERSENNARKRNESVGINAKPFKVSLGFIF